MLYPLLKPEASLAHLIPLSINLFAVVKWISHFVWRKERKQTQVTMKIFPSENATSGNGTVKLSSRRRSKCLKLRNRCGQLVAFLVGYVEERPWWPIQSPKQRKKEESERLRGERGQIKFIDLRFE